MAGLQYNFFPTDFFFPPQKTVTRESTHQQVVLARANDETEDVAKAKQLKINSNSKSLKAIPSSSSLALVHVNKQNQETSQ